MEIPENKIWDAVHERFPFHIVRPMAGSKKDRKVVAVMSGPMMQFHRHGNVFRANRDARWTFVNGFHFDDSENGYFFFENETDAVHAKLIL